MGLANSSPASIATKRRFASSLNLIVTPRLLRPGADPLQFRILYFVLCLRLTRLDFPAAMTVSP